jgi:hypothetical protein
VTVVIRRITIVFLAAALAGALLAVPALSKSGPSAVAAKKAKKKCKKAKKGKKGKKRKGCKSGGSAGATGLPGQATPSKPTPPDPPTTPPTLHVAVLGVSPNTVLAPDSATGQVTLDAAAPSGGQQVDLQSDTARVTLPSYVVVAPGQTDASFPVNTTLGPPVTRPRAGRRQYGDHAAQRRRHGKRLLREPRASVLHVRALLVEPRLAQCAGAGGHSCGPVER